jgi:hypothetical protein
MLGKMAIYQLKFSGSDDRKESARVQRIRQVLGVHQENGVIEPGRIPASRLAKTVDFVGILNRQNRCRLRESTCVGRGGRGIQLWYNSASP